MPAARPRSTVSRSMPLLIGLGVQSATSYLTLIVAGRSLGPTTFGYLSALYVLIASITVGLFLPLEQEVARRRGLERSSLGVDVLLVRRSVRVGAAVSLSAVVVLTIAVEPIQRIFGQHLGLLLALFVSIPGYALCFVSRGEFAGERQLVRYGTQLATEGVFRFIGVIALALLHDHDVVHWGWLFAVAPWLAFAIALAGPRDLIIGYLPFGRDPDGAARVGEQGPPLTGAVLWLILSSLAAQLVINAGPLVVALVAEPSERLVVGVFLAVLVVVRVPVILFAAIAPSVLPVMAAHAAADRREDYRKLVSRILVAAALLAGVSSLVAILAGPALVRLSFGFPDVLTRATIAEMTASVGLFLIAMFLAQALLARGHHSMTTLGWGGGLLGLALGALHSGSAVGRASTGFLAGASVATVILAGAVMLDLRRWAQYRPNPGGAVEPVAPGL